tara:strand:+ start:6148 stop:6987 length:840 start_codon:yes stop_codon:yes gene_type:complete
MISFFEDIFQYESFPTEYECYKVLSDIDNYIAVPWTQILNSHWFNFPGNKGRDYFLREISKYKVKTENNFTICQHDSFKQLELYFKHLNITKVFCTLHSKQDKIDGVDLIPISFAFNKEFSNDKKKDILVSFVGASTTHPLRETVKKSFTGPNFIYRDSYHIDSRDQDKEELELQYKNIMERSIFTLCPRGSSPSSVRFWESLSAGTIPVLISDDWALPEWDWDNTIVKIPEKDIANLTTMKLNVLLEPLNHKKMKEKCLEAYNKFKKQNFREYVLQSL